MIKPVPSATESVWTLCRRAATNSFFFALIAAMALTAVCRESVAQASGSGKAAPEPPARRAAADLIGRLPLRFEPSGDGSGMISTAGHRLLRIQTGGTVDVEAQLRGKTADLHLELEGGNARAAVTGAQELPGRSNYFLGNDRSQWRTGVGQFAQALVKDVYPGIDLVYYGNGNSLEHDFRVAPFGDPGLIRLRIGGGDPRVDRASGDLIVSSLDATVEMMRLRQPVAYQLRSDGSRASVAVGYSEAEDGSFQFSLGSYDRKRPLVIDPVILYGTYFGGSGDDNIVDLKLGLDGSIYLLMTTKSTDLTTKGNPSNTCGAGCGPVSSGGGDYYAAELDPTGQNLVFATYVGGSDSDQANNLALDSDGSVYIAGTTYSGDFPQVNAYPGGQPLDKGYAGTAGTLTKLSADGSQLLYSTYLGFGVPTLTEGTQYKSQFLVTANNGIVYLLGSAGVSDNPDDFIYKKNPLFTVGLDFVAKVDTTKAGTDAIVYATQIGDADSYDSALLSSLALDSKGDLWVYGTTYNAAFPVASTDAYQPACKVSATGYCNSGFLMELKPDGTSVLYSTFLGGTSTGDSFSSGSTNTGYMRLDASDNIYVSGATDQPDYPFKNGVYPTFVGSLSDYVSELTPDGKTLLYSTFLHGHISDIAVSANQQLAFAGYSGSGFPTKNNLQTTPPSGEFAADVVFGLIDTTLSGDDSLLISSYLGISGMSGSTNPGDIEFSSDGQFLIAGRTTATDLPIANAYQATCPSCTQSSGDGFIAAIQPSNTLTLTPTTLPFPSTAVGATSAAMKASLYNGTTQSIYLKQPTLSDSTDFTQSNDCNGILSPNVGCTITFTFTPKSSGTLTSTFTTGDLDDPSNLLTISLTGTGTASSATLSISTTALPFPDTAVGSTSSAMTATLSNKTSAIVNLTPPTLSNAADFSISANTCAATATIAPNGTCTFSFTFNPASTGQKTSTFSIADINNIASPSQVALSGNGTAAAKPNTVTPNSINFGPVPYQALAGQTVTFTNNGSSSVTLPTPQVSDPSVFGALDGTCFNNVVVPTGGSCTYTVIFIPEAIGNYSGTVTVMDGITNPVVTLAGVGTQPSTGSITMLPNAINFPNEVVGVPINDQYLKISNGSTASIQILSTDITINGTNAAQFAVSPILAACAPIAPSNCTYSPASGVGTLTFTIAAGGQLNLDLSMAGTGPADVTFAANLSVYWTLVGDPNAERHPLLSAVTGNFITPAAPSVTPSALSFPVTANGQTSAQKVTVSNGGDVPLSVNSVTVTGANANAFTPTNYCTVALNKADSCTISVVFTPGATGQIFAASMDIKLSTGDVNVPLAGTTNSKGDFTVASPSGTQSDPASWTINVAPFDASVPWNQPVTFTSDLDKSFGIVSFSPNQVTPGAMTKSTTATLTPPSSSARLERPLVNVRTGWRVFACCVLFFSLGRKFKSIRGRRILLLIACILLPAVTLKASSSMAPTVTFTVTATSGSVSHTVELTYQPPG
jgi:plastocyanin